MPTKRAEAYPDARLAVEREDVHGICGPVVGYTGACAQPCTEEACSNSNVSLAWFCVDERLFVLDCGKVQGGRVCRETATTWGCAAPLAIPAPDPILVGRPGTLSSDDAPSSSTSAAPTLVLGPQHAGDGTLVVTAERGTSP